ncbi:PaaI family thioesterase [Nocardia blacklockiae]|uniref:PaaI family thioesterase n=1 Tax=Nocardia blacklockiae TaxID=480036 RepID=UPI001893C8F1|nr:PaaI family thioesterase [Nocardia blacklockiae]MBF6176448.1 PaaI family thioesterase [Nocardia blacklockiae]
MTTALDLATARAVLAAQPFSRLIGAELTAYDADGVTLVIPLRADHRQQFGYVHGGVLAYAADNTLTYAAALALGPNVLTGGFTITYLRPARGVRLRAEARCTGATRRQAVCSCEIHAEDEHGASVLVAVAQGTTRAVEPERTQAN